MGKSKNTSRSKKIYRMKGCSKTRKIYLGGSSDIPLAYTGKPNFSVPNPSLAYTGKSIYNGKGGTSCGLTKTADVPINTNAENPAYPNTGPVATGAVITFNASSPQRGGGCGCAVPLIGGSRRKRKGGSCPICKPGFMAGGRSRRNRKRSVMKGGNAGIPYPDGLVGSPWTPNVSGWPGVNGIPGDRNYISENTYKNDISRQMVDVGANPPFLNMKGGKQKQNQKGGFLGQDLINLGRQFQFGVGSAYNALAGYERPINPLPWKDQLPTRLNMNSAII
jgi:hypothetical protein